MSEELFGELYNKLKMPVIVCRRDADFNVVFLNTAARLVFAPTLTVDSLRGDNKIGRLSEVVRFMNREDYTVFSRALRDNGTVEHLDTGVLSYQGDLIAARVYANASSILDNDYFIVYVDLDATGGAPAGEAEIMPRILKAAHHITNVDDAIQSILELAGKHAKVSRAYIFEDISPEITRNTYEWCAEGVAPAIQDLQNLDKREYNYAAIMNSAGMVITDDTRRLPDSDRDILLGQGIKSIAILPLFHYDKPLGYIGFDDCATHRQWSLEEIQLLENVASIVSSLINRRNAERESKRGRDIVQTVTDNLEDLVYISDLDTYELKFISKSLARSVRKPPEEIIGKPCWQVLHKGQKGPCPFCPLPRLKERRGTEDAGSYVWELHNSVTGKWYMVKDNIVDWIDGKPAHLGTFVDITYRKQYEEQLKRFAATDAMTDVYNRKWGMGKLEDLYQAPPEVRANQTLCFIDIDDLKSVNDRLGHAAGDEMIVNTIRTIFSCIRKDDFISRWGGDEFILFLDCRLADAKNVMEKISFAIEHFNSTQNKPYTLAISHGLVDFSAPYASLQNLIDEADRRMYRNKLRKRKAAMLRDDS